MRSRHATPRTVRGFPISRRRGTLPRVNGYAASARVIGVQPRLVDRGRSADRWAIWPVPEPAVVEDIELSADAEPVISLDERWERFRDRWSQLTFFLTDPNSWR
jgi:hypothetical protein